MEESAGAVTVRKWLMGAVCAAILAAAPQGAQAFDDGHKLLEFVSFPEDTKAHAYYGGYVSGVAHTLTLLEHICFEGNNVPSPNALSSIVLAWLHLNPDKRDAHGTVVTTIALTEHFSCN